MQTVVIVLHLLIVLAMIGLVLLQRSEGGALGIGGGGGGGGGGGFLTSRGSSNVLTKATAGLAAAFFVTSLTLSILAGWGRTEQSIIRTQPSPAAPGAPATPSPGDNILDQIRPPAPSAPQVPQSQ